MGGIAVHCERIVLADNRSEDVEQRLAAEFDRILSKYPPSEYHTHKIDCRFPRGCQQVYYAKKEHVSKEEFDAEVKYRWDNEYAELCSY